LARWLRIAARELSKAWWVLIPSDRNPRSRPPAPQNRLVAVHCAQRPDGRPAAAKAGGRSSSSWTRWIRGRAAAARPRALSGPGATPRPGFLRIVFDWLLMFERPRVLALDDRLGREIPVLNHGFVRLVDYMGDDGSIVEAARVSYGQGTRSVRDDRALIRYLLSHAHTTPFEMAELKLHVKLPIFVARQWIRHRTASVNEYSARYSILDREFYVPDERAVAAQSKSNRQGRGDPLPPEEAARAVRRMSEGAERAYVDYQELLAEDAADGEGTAGLARELARSVLPVSYYTQWFWKVDLHNLLRFLELRLDEHAQWEIRQYADAIASLVREWVPVTWEAFRDYRLEAATLSGPALRVVRSWLSGNPVEFGESRLTRREWDALRQLLGR
jgi:thymidylate synthase (FAD)